MLHRKCIGSGAVVILPRFAWGPDLDFLFCPSCLSLTKSYKNKRKQMSDNESDTIYSESEMSEDSDSGDSLASFVADDEEELEVCVSCRGEICPSNIVTKKRRHVEVDHESSNSDEGCDDEGDEDSSSDYVCSEADESSSEADTSSEDE